MTLRTLMLLIYLPLLSLSLVLTGCSLLESSTEGEAIDPPPQSTQSSVQTLYFLDPYDDLVPLSVHLPIDPDRQTAQVVQALTYGNPQSLALKLPSGFRAPIPQDTAVRQLTYIAEQKRVQLDLSEHFLQYNAADERKILESLVWSLTELPGIRAVSMTVEGKALTEMPVTGFPLEQQLTRAMGINLERVAQTAMVDSMPLTVFFQRTNEHQFRYLLPVTRFVAHTKDVAREVLAQSVAGPLYGSRLQSTWPPAMTLEQLVTEQQPNRLTLHLPDGKQQGQIRTEVLDQSLQALAHSLALVAPEYAIQVDRANQATVIAVQAGQQNGSLETSQNSSQHLIKLQKLNMISY